MNSKVDKALARLIEVLPLKEKQLRCGPEVRDLHRRVLRSFVERGTILSRSEMAEVVADIDRAAAVLKNNDMVVFACGGEPIGAYPFTMEEREHKVRVGGYTVNAMCALDALAVSPMFGLKTEISSKCRATGAPVFIKQDGLAIENPDQVGDLRFGIVWGAASSCSCCADSLCMEMMFLHDGRVAGEWLAADPGNREVFTLPEAVDFGARFFVPLMSD
jgi:mercuric reductase